MLENILYEKCDELIVAKLLNPGKKYTILAKSAGCGICLNQLIHSQIHKLLLFAHGVQYLS
jgi:hypothetical protein